MNKEALLSYFPSIHLKRYQTIIAAFGNLDTLWSANEKTIAEVWGEKTSHNFVIWRDTFDADTAEAELQRDVIACIPYSDPGYPALLKNIFDPPYALFVRGKIQPVQYLAVVGTRVPTRYGYDAVQELVPPLARKNIGIVSGLAAGIDSAAHQATLAAKGITIAVLGSGVDDTNITPRFSLRLARTIIESNGAVISEYPPGTPAAKYSFASRNRIIAGLAKATLVIEARAKSGALITASCSLDNGRDVLTIPHPILAPTGVGPNQLIKNGATPIVSANDVLEYFGLASATPNTVRELPPDLTAEELAIMRHISTDPTPSDQIARELQEPVSHVLACLTQLELKSLIKSIGGSNYIRV